ncbi:MAG: hypothetical protein MUF50_00805 [Planctomycetes bacterium]|jgi:NTP pyrophosphatase (non-canonical NTP hydrolase)|nr:hypothetical protein [Planctomycetota bacterium]
MSLQKLGEKVNNLEDNIGLSIDDVLNKLTQELGEFNDAVQKYRGRYCREKTLDLKKVEDELGDLLTNIISLGHRLGVDVNNIEFFIKNTISKFEERQELYKKNLE